MIGDLPSVVLNDPCAAEQAQGCTDRKHRTNEPLGLGHLGRRKVLPDHREREREHRESDSLKPPQRDQEVDRVEPREAEERRDLGSESSEAEGDRVDAEDDDQNSLLSVDVAQLRKEGGRGNPDEQIGGDDPGNRGVRYPVKERHQGRQGGY